MTGVPDMTGLIVADEKVSHSKTGVAEAEADTNDCWPTELTMVKSCPWLRRCSLLPDAEHGWALLNDYAMACCYHALLI